MTKTYDALIKDLVDEEFMAKVNKRKADGPRKRDGVSAESYGKHNKKEDFQPVVVQKDQKQRVAVAQARSASWRRSGRTCF